MNNNELPPQPRQIEVLPESAINEIRQLLQPVVDELLAADSQIAKEAEIDDFVAVHMILSGLPTMVDDEILLEQFATVLADVPGGSEDKLSTLTYCLPRYIRYCQVLSEQSEELKKYFSPTLLQRADFISEDIQKRYL